MLLLLIHMDTFLVNQFLNIYIGGENKGAYSFHSTKNSSSKFRVFHVTNRTVFPGWLKQTVPGYHVPSFARKFKQQNKGKH